ncbi:MAG: hypothetical protein RL885_30525 [Planctomycetota bacterium]
MASRLFLFFLAVYLLTSYGRLDNNDLEVVFQTTRSIAEDGSFAIGDTPQGRYIKSQNPPFDVMRGSDGRYYSWFGVGHAVLGLPGYWLGQTFAGLFPDTLSVGEWERMWVCLTNAFLGALVVVLLYRTGRRLGYSSKIATIAVVAYGLGTLAWQHARGGFPGTACTLALALGLLGITSYARRGERRHLWVASSALACGVAIRMPTAVGALILGIWALFAILRRRDWLGLVAFGMPAAIGAGLLMWVNDSRFGDPLETGYGEVTEGGFFQFPIWLGLLFQIASPARSFILYALPSTLGLFTIWKFGRKCRAEAIVVFSIFIAYLLFHASIHGWHGAWTWGPRYLLPALALLTLPLMAFLEWAAQKRWRTAIAAVLLLASFGIQALGVAVHYGTAIEVSQHGAARRYPQRAEPELWLMVLMREPLFCPIRVHAKILAVKLRWPRPETYDAEDLFGAAGPPIQARERSETGIPNSGFEHIGTVMVWKTGSFWLCSLIVIWMIAVGVLGLRLVHCVLREPRAAS